MMRAMGGNLTFWTSVGRRHGSLVMRTSPVMISDSAPFTVIRLDRELLKKSWFGSKIPIGSGVVHYLSWGGWLRYTTGLTGNDPSTGGQWYFNVAVFNDTVDGCFHHSVNFLPEYFTVWRMEPRVKERYDGLLKRRWATADFVRPPFHGVLSHILEHLGIIIFILYFLCNITLSITTNARKRYLFPSTSWSHDRAPVLKIDPQLL